MYHKSVYRRPISFLMNVHLKYEFYASLHHVGFKNDYSPLVSVGKIHKLPILLVNREAKQCGMNVWGHSS